MDALGPVRGIRARALKYPAHAVYAYFRTVRKTGVPVATIKYYLRSGLLHDGRLTAPRQAEYIYGRAMRAIADRELDQVPLESSAEAMRYVVLGTVLIEPLLLALRRLAHQDASGRKFAEIAPEA